MLSEIVAPDKFEFYSQDLPHLLPYLLNSRGVKWGKCWEKNLMSWKSNNLFCYDVNWFIQFLIKTERVNIEGLLENRLLASIDHDRISLFAAISLLSNEPVVLIPGT